MNSKLQILAFLIPIILVFMVLGLIAPKPSSSELNLPLQYYASTEESFAKTPPSLQQFEAITSPIQLKHQGETSYHWFYIDGKAVSSLKDPALAISPFIVTDIEIFKGDDFSQPIASKNRFEFSDSFIHTNQSKVFFLEDHKNAEHFYLKIPEKRTITAKIELWEFHEFLVQDTKTNSFFSAILFGIFLMVVINSFFYITIRDNAYLYYILYHSSMLVLILNVTGFLYHYPSLAWLGKDLSKGLMFLCLTSFFFATFVRQFLNTVFFTPKLDKVISFYQVAYAVAFVLCVLFPTYDLVLLTPINALALSGVAYYALLMFFHWRAKNRQAIFFTLAFSTLLFVIIFRFLYVWDLVPQSFFTQYGVIVAIMFEALVFSIGLADRLVQMRIQRDTANLEKAKTAFVYNLEKDFNRLLSKINSYIHQSDQKDHKQYIIDEFFNEFKDKLGVNSNAVIYKTAADIKTVYDTRHRKGFNYEIVEANLKQIANIAKLGQIKKIRGRNGEFLIVPVTVRDHEWSACLLELGHDFVKSSAVKAFIENYSSELVRSILNAESLSDIKTQAEIDKLTGLYNRHAIEAFIDHELKKNFNPNNPLSIAFIDFDDFKTINDRYGHQAGDRCLQALAETFKQYLPAGCQIGRYGGDEFIVVMPGINQFRALNITNKAKNKLSAIEHEDQIINFSVSIGIASQNNQVTSLKQLLEQSDKALYESKDSGKNTISVA
ncbi:diguanylate cyclase [Kangiella sp. TOML190]|uniref:sensor domain-containing diguanylate cyclase n=1 Tax=Kangiella sp. TOML190 TaxID=2931351 RepID=UPI0020418CBB|nr:diguanylate cyclase [Kangiella sp. TOML190]